MTEQLADEFDLTELAADVVGAYVRRNSISPTELPKLLKDVHDQLRALVDQSRPPPPVAPPVPAVPIRRSIQETTITCLDCGARLKALRRHLATAHGMSPTEYRARWDLPPDYPLVAPSYSADRSALAKRIGLGKKKTEADDSTIAS